MADNKIDCEEEMVDLMNGAHHQEPFASLNPNRLVPMLVDGDLKLTESSAILKYLADKIGSPTYPKDLKERAKVNEAMDWINTNFYRDWGYGSAIRSCSPTTSGAATRRSRDVEWGKRIRRIGSGCSTIIGSARSRICAAIRSRSRTISAPGS